jgi:glycosyltransferase involved in cell wall biosynthesis
MILEWTVNHTRNLKLFLRGVIWYVSQADKKYDEAAYIKKNIYKPIKSAKKAKPRYTKSKTKVWCSGPRSISGWWLRFPKIHYYTFNYKECKPIPAMIHKFKSDLNPTKETWLIGLHELSRTGAPILGFELAMRIKEERNIIVVSLRDGPLRNHFEKKEIPVFIANENTLKDILALYSVSNAILSSICTYPFLDAAHKKNIPITCLIHEFHSCVSDKKIFNEVHAVATRIVYPAQLVAKNAIEADETLDNGKIEIIPQGLIKAPNGSSHNKQKEELRKIKRRFRPHRSSSETVVVLGLGTIEPRKGVDLFISTAQMIYEEHPESNFRFIWIGHYLHESMKHTYGVFLEEQIERSGLQHVVEILDPIENLEIAYQNADIFFLSSRMDPLPLVSIEAMHYGIPLVCFEEASGIAEYLQENEGVSYGVVSYLSIRDASRRIHELITNKPLRKNLGSEQKAYADNRFNMNSYVDQIVSGSAKLITLQK